MALSLAWRAQSSFDLGYHLAYGNSCVNSGQIMDSNRFLYTPDYYPGEPDSMNFAPGSWRDAGGRYRFPNPNYASQVVMALVYGWGGFTGLCLLQELLVAACMILLLVTMRRMGVPVLLCAVGILLVAWAMYERFNLRPELFAFVFLAAQLAILGGRGPAQCSLGPFGAAGLIVLQGLFVQFHGYWIFGLAMTGVYFATSAGAMVLAKWRRFPPDESRSRRFQWLAATLIGQAAIAFVNPWGWRLAVSPILTLIAVNSPGTAGEFLLGGRHPYATVSELFPTFAAGFANTRTTWAIAILLAMAGIGLLAALGTRRWNWAFLLLAFALTAMSMRRNIAPAAIVLTPISLVAISAATGALARRLRDKRPVPDKPPAGPGRFFVPALAGLVLALSAAWTFGVATNRFYYAERKPWRFGAGCSNVDIPVATYQAAVFLARDTRIFCSFNVSSNLLFFGTAGSARLELPILTNALAYPPMTMSKNIAMCAGEIPFEEFFVKYNVGVVVLDCAPPFSNAPLAQALRAKQWTLARIDGRTVVFVRPDLPAPTPNWQDKDVFLAATAAADPMPAFALDAAGCTLNYLQMDDLAIDAFSRARDFDPENPLILNALGKSYYNRTVTHFERWEKDHRATDLVAARKDRQQAYQCFEQTLGFDPHNAEAREYLVRLDMLQRM